MLRLFQSSGAVEDVITRSRTTSGHVDGADDLLCPKVECVEEKLAMSLTTTAGTVPIILDYEHSLSENSANARQIKDDRNYTNYSKPNTAQRRGSCE
jgi:hypothetical protein